MVRFFYVFLALLSISPGAWALSMPVLTYTSGLCTDSDGLDPYTGGNVSVLFIDRATYYKDYCADDNTLIEWSCRFRGAEEKNAHQCPAGHVCRDGRCDPAYPAASYEKGEHTCVDPDGLNATASTRTVIYLSDNVEYSLTDTCSGWFNVSEAYCAEEDGEQAGRYALLECANGSFCRDGACIPSGNAASVQRFTATPRSSSFAVSRDLAYTASSGTDLYVRLKAHVEPSSNICAYGISEKVPVGWNIQGASASGVVGKFPGNGSVRMAEAITSLNAFCAGDAGMDAALEALSRWRENGVSPGSVEWIFWDIDKNASGADMVYRVAIPYNASINSECYGDYTSDGQKYQKTAGNYRLIIQPAGTTTTTTTTTLPVSRISGIIYHAETGYPVPDANVTVLCSGNAGMRIELAADEYGYYTTEMLCPYGAEASVYASGGDGEICKGLYDCIYYYPAKGSASGTVTSPGYARVDVTLFVDQALNFL